MPQERPPETDRVGLCRSCRFGDAVASSRGAEFWRCLRSLEEPEYSRYPRLPVVVCRGYEPRQP